MRILRFLINRTKRHVLFYTNVEGWTALDAIYFSVVSLIPTGVETGFTPVINLWKVFTMMFLIVRVRVMQ